MALTDPPDPHRQGPRRRNQLDLRNDHPRARPARLQEQHEDRDALLSPPGGSCTKKKHAPASATSFRLILLTAELPGEALATRWQDQDRQHHRNFFRSWAPG